MARIDLFPGMNNRLKWAFAFFLGIAGFAVFYFPLIGLDLWMRVLLLVLALVMVGVIIAGTEAGALVITYLTGARGELKKVVWPDRQETIRTTAVVLAMVLLVAVFLGLVDAGLAYGLKLMLGSGG